MAMGKQINFKQRLYIQPSFNHPRLAEMSVLLKAVFLYTIFIEAIGAFFLTLRFMVDYPLSKAVYFGVFHAVTAFNNAGFDLFGGYRSLTLYTHDPFVNVVIMGLIILGGDRLCRPGRASKGAIWTLHTKIVLSATGALLAFGTFTFLLFEYTNPGTIGTFSLWDKMMSSFFHSVSSRTDGFNTINLAELRNREDLNLFDRRIPRDQVWKALTITFLSLGLIAVATLSLSISEKAPLLYIWFEATSAFGTVGLSLGITPMLTDWGNIVITITMFLGRVGTVGCCTRYSSAPTTRSATASPPSESRSASQRPRRVRDADGMGGARRGA